MKIFKHGTGIVTALLLSFNAWALDECYTASWQDMNRDKSGADIQILDNSVIAGFKYTTNPNTMLGANFVIHGEVYGLVSEYEAAARFDIILVRQTSPLGVIPVTAIEQIVGEGLLYGYPEDQDRLAMVWGLWIGIDGKACEGQCVFEQYLQRITQPIKCDPLM